MIDVINYQLVSKMKLMKSRNGVLLLISMIVILSSTFCVSQNIQPTSDEIIEPKISPQLCPYKLPWSNNLGMIKVSQGNFGKVSHYGDMKYAVDFDLDAGDIVLASRDGKVIKAYGEETECGGREYINKANYVVIDHQDGTSSLYLHLKNTCVIEGKDVKQGEPIGTVGNTGWTDCGSDHSKGFHLHYQVQYTTSKIFGQSQELCFQEKNNGKKWEINTNDKFISSNVQTKEASTCGLELSFFDNDCAKLNLSPEECANSGKHEYSLEIICDIDPTKYPFYPAESIFDKKGVRFNGTYGGMSLRKIGHNTYYRKKITEMYTIENTVTFLSYGVIDERIDKFGEDIIRYTYIYKLIDNK